MSNAFGVGKGMADFTFFTGGPAQTHGYWVHAAQGQFVVDAPEGMAQWLRGQGAKIEALLLTHQHFDHVGDAAEVADEYGCPILGFAQHSKALTLELLYAASAGVELSIPAFQVSRLLKAGETLQLCGERLQCLHLPGHSPDSLAFHWAASEILFGGDVLFAGSVGRTDLPGGSMTQLLEGILRELRPLPEATRVLPGHGPQTTLKREWQVNPYLQESLPGLRSQA